MTMYLTLYSSVFKNLSFALLGILIYFIYNRITTAVARRRFREANECKSTAAVSKKYDMLGICMARKIAKAHREHTLLQELYELFESNRLDTIKLRVPFKTIVITREPEILKTIQAVEFSKWGLGEDRKREFSYLLGTGIFSSNGREWQHSRDMLRPNFVRSQVADLEMFERHVGDLVHAIPKDGSTIDLQALFFRLTMDSATEFLFGESTGCLKPGVGGEKAERFAEAFGRAQERMEKEEWLGKLSWLIRTKQYKEDCRFVHDFADCFVEKGLSRSRSTMSDKSQDRYIFLDELVSQTSDKIRIRSELLNVLLAGRDTTASLLSNVFHMLARRPDVQKTLRTEVEEHLGGNVPSFVQIKEMKYLRAVLNESLRIHPVVPTNSREALVDTVLPLGGGKDGKSPMFIPKGGRVSWSVYSMHRRRDLFGEDAEEFRPERWLGEKGLRPTWEYLPFNGGARICLGQQYALTEASYVAIRLLQQFEMLENRDPHPWREWLTLTCTGFGGCKVALIPA